MMHVVKLVILVLACAHVTGCAARSRMGEVVVTQSGSQPCFGLENTAATRQGQHRLWSIAVYKRSGDKPQPVWVVTLAPQNQAQLIAPPVCVPYGQAPAQAAVSTAPIGLETGVLYSVSIGARGTDASDPTRSYSGEFCLIRKTSEPITVHQIQWDAQAEKWQRDICREK
jgi:hypothetical protein